MPAFYIPGNFYDLVISVAGGPATNNGGFDLSVTAGTLTTADPNAKIDQGEATHANPNTRSWTVRWQAPTVSIGIVTFNVAGNAVNGDGTTSGDGWNQNSYTSNPAAVDQNPTISISSPDGTQDWTGGTPHPITWTMSDDITPISNLIVFLNYSSSASSGPIAGPLLGVTTYPWTVPLIDATDAKVNATVIDTVGLKGYHEMLVPRIDSTPPGVIDGLPTGSSVPINAPVVIKFSETMDRTSTQAALVINPTVGGLAPSWSQTNFSDDTLTVNHDLFQGSTLYTVNLTKTARDVSDTGNALSMDYEWQFTTATGADTTPPTITSVTSVPSPGQIGQPVNVSATVQDDVAVGLVQLNVTLPGGTTLNASMLFDSQSGKYYLSRSYDTAGAHAFVIWASDTAGNWNSYSGQFTVTDTTSPAAPQNLVVTVEGTNSLKLTWTANSEPDIAGYRIHRSLTQGGPYTLLNPTTLVTANTYTDQNLASGQTYYYVVTAVDTSGNESPNSNEASGRMEGPTGTGGAIPDWLWLVILVVIIVVILLLVLMLRARGRKKKYVPLEPGMEGTRQL